MVYVALAVTDSMIPIVRKFAGTATVPDKKMERTVLPALRIVSAESKSKKIARTASKGDVTGNAIRKKTAQPVRTARRDLSPTAAVTESAKERNRLKTVPWTAPALPTHSAMTVKAAQQIPAIWEPDCASIHGPNVN